MSFADVTRLHRLDDGTFEARFDESWGQGRALYGGIQAAALVRAFRESGVPEERSLRTLALHFCRAAAPGELEVRAEVERSGRYVTQTSGRILQEGETMATALASFARPRGEDREVRGNEMPELPPPEALPEVPLGPHVPSFLQHADLRLTADSAPFSGAETPDVAGWCRLLDPGPLDDAVLAGILDLWPPSLLPVLPEPRPAASVDLRYDVFGEWPPEGAGPETFWPFRCRTLHADAGYVVDEGELWSPDGRAIARVRQLRALF